MRHSIRWKLVMITCLGICLSFAVFTLVVRHVLVADHTQQIREGDIQMTDVLAKNIRQYIGNAFNVERMLTDYPHLMQRSEAEQTQLLHNMIEIHPIYELLAITDMNGMQTARSRGVKTNRADRLWFIKFVLNGKPDVSPVYHSAYSLHPIITLVQGIYQDGQAEGLVMADIRTDELQEFIMRYNEGSDCRAYLLDQVGTAIAQPDMETDEGMYNFATRERTFVERNEDGYPVYDRLGRLVLGHEPFSVDPGLHKVIVSAMSQEKGTAEYVDAHGERQLCAYRAIDMPQMDGHWTLVLVRPYSTIADSMVSAWQKMLAAGALAAVLASLGVLAFSRRITRPISELIQEAQAVRDGDLSGRIGVSGEGELGILSSTFNEMLDALRSAVEKRERAEAQIRSMAFHDNLTHLPNRAYFSMYMKDGLEDSMKKGGEGAFFFVDADRFKHVNDTYGHAVGDKLLVSFGQRLVRIAGDSNRVCRFGGDEFVMMLPDIGEAEAEEKAREMVSVMREPFLFEEAELCISASVGAACYPRDAGNVQILLRRADAALYAAKRRGRDRAVFYAPGMENELEE